MSDETSLGRSSFLQCYDVILSMYNRDERGWNRHGRCAAVLFRQVTEMGGVECAAEKLNMSPENFEKHRQHLLLAEIKAMVENIMIPQPQHSITPMYFDGFLMVAIHLAGNDKVSGVKVVAEYLDIPAEKFERDLRRQQLKLSVAWRARAAGRDVPALALS